MAKGKRKRPQGNPARRAPQAPVRRPGPPAERPALSRRALAAGVAFLLLAGLAGVLLTGGGDGSDTEGAAAPEDLAVPWVDPGGVRPVVGAIDVNPADDAVWLSTNTGLWRVPPAGGEPQKVTGTVDGVSGRNGISQELVVRFRGPDRLIASGHPPADSDLPPALGLLESDDAGATWSELSGLGETDFHSIQLSGDAIVAGVFQAAAASISRDGGKTFEERVTPAPLIDLEADPRDPARLIASTQAGVIGSADEGKTWRERDRIPNVRFAWPEPDALYRIDPGGPVELSRDGGRRWEDRGSTGGEPQAMFADSADHLLVALIDGTVKESDDGGRTWTDLVTPPT